MSWSRAHPHGGGGGTGARAVRSADVPGLRGGTAGGAAGRPRRWLRGGPHSAHRSSAASDPPADLPLAHRLSRRAAWTGRAACPRPSWTGARRSAAPFSVVVGGT